MSFLSDVVDWLSALWDKFKSAMTQIFQVLKKIAVVLLIIAAIVFLPGVGAAIGLSIASSWWIVGLLLVAAYLLDPEFTSEIIQDIGDVLGEIAGEVGEVAAVVATGFFASLFGSLSSPLGLVMLLGVGYLLLSKKKDTNPVYLTGTEDINNDTKP
jgi:hypothetical protein